MNFHHVILIDIIGGHIMPKLGKASIGENMIQTIVENSVKSVKGVALEEVTPLNVSTEMPPPKRTDIKKAEEYSARSPVAKAYRSGTIPLDHARLLSAIKEVLGSGVSEGSIQLKEVLDKTGYIRHSALNMLRHMEAFGVLHSEPCYKKTYVKISSDWLSRDS